MHRLLYVSSSRTPITASEIEAILRVSRRNNAANGVTGLLVTGGRRFLQVLEGERADIEATYARIGADPRHHALVRLAASEITARLFGDWSMGHVTGRGDDSVRALTAAITDPTLRAYFDGFVELHAAA